MTEAGHRSQVTGEDRTFSDGAGKTRQPSEGRLTAVSGEWPLERLPSTERRRRLPGQRGHVASLKALSGFRTPCCPPEMSVCLSGWTAACSDHHGGLGVAGVLAFSVSGHGVYCLGR